MCVTKLTELPLGVVGVITHVGGAGSFRRRLMELGILPGTRVEVRGVAPFGDPLELLVRGSSLSIRRGEALSVQVDTLTETSAARDASKPNASAAELVSSGGARGAL